MTKRVISTLCIGCIFLGLAVSLCLGTDEYPPQSTDVRDSPDPSDNNNQNLRLMDVIQQYAEKFNNRNPTVEDEEEVGTRRKRNMFQDATKSEKIQKRETEEVTIGEIGDYATGKRGLSSQKNPLDMGFKNRPGFRSWGGKRSKFVTWGGKRFTPEFHRFRKSKFNNWGGKRSAMAEGDTDRWDEKVTFRSWGGKRGELVPPTLRTVYDSHSKFSNWGGKRFDGNDHKSEKRDLEYILPYEQDDESEFDGKRGQFQSWGGKRFDRIGDGYLREDIIGMNWLLRQYLNSLVNQLQSERRIGKKNILRSRPLGDDDDDDDGDFSTSGFSAWRGRR